LAAGTGITVFCISRIKQKSDKKSDAMLKTDIETPNALNLLFQEKLEALKKQYEKIYANSNDETFNLATTQMFQQLASTMTFSTNSKLFLAERLHQAANLVRHFSQQYQEFITQDFKAALLKLESFLNLYEKFFKAFALMDIGDEEEDKAKKYASYQESYQLLGKIAENNWADLSVEIRNEFETFAIQIQNKTGSSVLSMLN
jgi:hypothetical protein